MGHRAPPGPDAGPALGAPLGGRRRRGGRLVGGQQPLLGAEQLRAGGLLLRGGARGPAGGGGPRRRAPGAARAAAEDGGGPGHREKGRGPAHQVEPDRAALLRGRPALLAARGPPQRVALGGAGAGAPRLRLLLRGKGGGGAPDDCLHVLLGRRRGPGRASGDGPGARDDRLHPERAARDRLRGRQRGRLPLALPGPPSLPALRGRPVPRPPHGLPRGGRRRPRPGGHPPAVRPHATGVGRGRRPPAAPLAGGAGCRRALPLRGGVLVLRGLAPRLAELRAGPALRQGLHGSGQDGALLRRPRQLLRDPGHRHGYPHGRPDHSHDLVHLPLVLRPGLRPPGRPRGRLRALLGVVQRAPALVAPLARVRERRLQRLPRRVPPRQRDRPPPQPRPRPLARRGRGGGACSPSRTRRCCS